MTKKDANKSANETEERKPLYVHFMEREGCNECPNKNNCPQLEIMCETAGELLTVEEFENYVSEKSNLSENGAVDLHDMFNFGNDLSVKVVTINLDEFGENPLEEILNKVFSSLEDNSEFPSSEDFMDFDPDDDPGENLH